MGTAREVLEMISPRLSPDLARGLIDGAALRLHRETVVVATRGIGMLRPEMAVQKVATERAVHV